MLGALMRGVSTHERAGIEATGKPMEVQSALIFVFEGENLVCEKVCLDHATVLRRLAA